MNDLFYRLAPAVALCLPLSTLAQTGRADPSDPKAAAPQLQYRSAFFDYKPWQDIKPSDWRAVNDNVRGAAATGGGRAGHTAAPSSPAASAPAKTMPAHSGHQMHGGHQ